MVVKSKTGRLGDALTKPENSIFGLNLPLKYPEVNNNQKNAPDFRSTIHWNPAIEFDETGKASTGFSTSDDIGSYSLILEGVTENGELFFEEKRIRVKLN